MVIQKELFSRFYRRRMPSTLAMQQRPGLGYVCQSGEMAHCLIHYSSCFKKNYAQVLHQIL